VKPDFILFKGLPKINIKSRKAQNQGNENYVMQRKIGFLYIVTLEGYFKKIHGSANMVLGLIYFALSTAALMCHQ
jgi:hypothetical protein